MHRRAKPGKPRRTRRARAFLAWASVGLCAALTSAGCSTTHQAANDKLGDPLLGPALPPHANQPAHASAPAGLGPIPTAGGSTTAALAGGSSPSLSIGDADGWARKVDGASPAAGTPKAPVIPVSQPKVYSVPKDEPGVTTAPVQALQPTGSWQANGPSSTALPGPEQLDALLQSRGVIGHKQEAVPGGIHLTCAVASPTNPNANQIYQTTAVDYATAVQAIVQQIDGRK